MQNLFRRLTRAPTGSRKDLMMPKGSSEPHPDQYWELAFWEITNGLWKITWCINEELHSCPRVSEKDSQRPGVGGPDQLPHPYSSWPSPASFLLRGRRRGAVLSLASDGSCPSLGLEHRVPCVGCTSSSLDTSQPCSKPQLMCDVSETLHLCKYCTGREQCSYTEGSF